jgi:hypothetical protein
MSGVEKDVSEVEQLEAARRGAWLLRNNSGAFKDTRGVLVRYGLGNVSKRFNEVMKSSDLVGLEPVIITEEMVGMTMGRFLAIECKRPNWKYTGDEREVAQKRFIDKVLELGGRAYFSTGTST